MPDQTEYNPSPKPPPKGDEQKGEKYLKSLIKLIDENKLQVLHTDLNKFDPSSLYDHYRMDFKDYQVEVSHSKQPNSGADSYVIIFTNLKNIQAGTCEKIILAYTQLEADQFRRFKATADDQLERKRRIEEEKRFNEAMTPVDQALEELEITAEHEQTAPLPEEAVTEENESEPEIQPPAPRHVPHFSD